MQQQLEQLIRSTVASLGFDLWGCEFRSGGQGALLCVYVDGEHGVTADNCTAIARQLRAVLAVESSLGDQTALEVSSPGIERRLYALSHYQRYVGHQIKFSLVRAKDHQRNFEGEIKQVNQDDDTVELLVAQETWLMALHDIEKARLVVEF